MGIFDTMIATLTAVEGTEISFLYFLYLLKSAQGYKSLVDSTGGAQQDRIKGGAQQISELLANKLGSSVILNSPVHKIEQDVYGVSIYTEKKMFRAKYCIITIPIHNTLSITFSPPLPTFRAQLAMHMTMGSTIKIICCYKTAFWRQNKLSGSVLSLDGPIALIFDDCAYDTLPALVMFICGQTARQLTLVDASVRKKKVLDQLVSLFGEEAKDPTHFIEKNWLEDPWSHGCYFETMSIGILSTFGKFLREPFANIHWAGTETAAEWYGYMDGAVSSGYRAANEIIRAFKPSHL